MQITHHRVVDVLDPGAVEAHIVGGPAAGECVAASRQFPDEITQGAIIGVLAGLAPQDGDDIVGRTVPVREEGPGRRVEEDEPSAVHRADRVAAQLGIEGAAELVRGQDVAARVPDVRRRNRHRADRLLHPGSDSLRARTGGARRTSGGASQRKQMDALGLVEVQGSGEGLPHTVGDAAQIAPLEPDVVVDAHPGQQCHLLPTKTRHAPGTAVRRQSRCVGGDLGPPGGQELADLLGGAHHPTLRRASAPREALPIPVTCAPAHLSPTSRPRTGRYLRSCQPQQVV